MESVQVMLQEGTEDGRQSWLSLENTVCPTDLPSGVAKPKVPTGTWSWVCFPSLTCCGANTCEIDQVGNERQEEKGERWKDEGKGTEKKGKNGG